MLQFLIIALVADEQDPNASGPTYSTHSGISTVVSFDASKAYASENGKRCVPHHTLAEKKAYYNQTLMHFSPSERRLINPHYYKVDISDDLYNLKMGIINKIVKEINDFKL